MDEGGSGMGRLYLKRLRGGGLGGNPLLGTLEDMLGKSLDAGITLREEEARMPGTLVGDCRRAAVVGHLSVKGSMKGTLGEGSFTGEPNR